jgi:ribonuclease-3
VAGRGQSRLRPRIEAALGHRFANPRWIDEALDHAGRIGGRHGAHPPVAHERLEFLGDRVLGLLIAEALVSRFPDEPEGALNLRLVELVRAETEAEIAAALGVPAWLRARAGQAGTQIPPSLLADTLESLIAGLYLDGGLEVARTFVLRQWESRLEAVGGPRRDAKTALQEWAQARGLALPAYRRVATTGPDHAPYFAVEVLLPGHLPQSGEGPSKRMAEQAAAAKLLETLQEGSR